MWFLYHFSFVGEKRYKSELKALGKRIFTIRKQKGLIQLDLEIKCNISRADISKIENGLKNVEFLTIVKIAEALDVETIELFKKK